MKKCSSSIKTMKERAFLNGHAFTHSDYRLNVASDNVTDYLFDPTACTMEKIITEVPTFNATAGPVTVEFYLNPTISANGTELLVFNRRTSSANVPKSKIYVGPTVTSAGTRFSGLMIAATDTPQNAGSTSTPGLPFELDVTKKVLMRVTNHDGISNIGHRIEWLEIPDA